MKMILTIQMTALTPSVYVYGREREREREREGGRGRGREPRERARESEGQIHIISSSIDLMMTLQRDLSCSRAQLFSATPTDAWAPH